MLIQQSGKQSSNFVVFGKQSNDDLFGTIYNHRSSLTQFEITGNQSIEIPEFIPGLPLLENGNNGGNNTWEETNGADMFKTSFKSPEERQKSKSLDN